ncbi:conserved hypothetical protein [Alkaliphilus metalliredigens QYMF]|uniref:SipL SPOCS domain-containing protein n=2 Tax=Alkaliphilus TaxID=114627 RepID=A6TQY5_ALKMQ|nr:conserved hypothetical protein [Alkaliphilus metalliredigens QYMF]
MENNFDLSPGATVSLDHKFSDLIAECIIVDKVYAHCQQRECFEDIRVSVPQCGKLELVDITFNPGEIIDQTLVITPIPHRPHFSRVRFRVLITFVLHVRDIKTGVITPIVGQLPEIQKDIVIFIPQARDEFAFEIVIETASQLLNQPIQDGEELVFAVGTFIIVKVVGRVQLFVPAFGFCPEPPDCEEFAPDAICDDFDQEPFPEFFPRQLQDIPEDELF